MTTVIVSHRVADYDAWRRVFDSVVTSPHRVWRGQDDPNLVVVCETYDSREAAEGAFGESTVAAMSRAGVDADSLRIEYLDDVTEA
jgi:hypothetical protein